MLANLERPTAEAPGLRRIFADSGLGYLANGLIGFIFSATGPVAIREMTVERMPYASWKARALP